MSEGVDLVALPIPAALRAKWDAGRARHGAAWVGAHPLVELHAELLDAVNYADEAARRGVDTRALRAGLLTLLGEVRELITEVCPSDDPPPGRGLSVESMAQMARDFTRPPRAERC